jgi:cysteine sulfinate desulfinase/cysteine desulfurase-like protein
MTNDAAQMGNDDREDQMERSLTGSTRRIGEWESAPSPLPNVSNTSVFKQGNGKGTDFVFLAGIKQAKLPYQTGSACINPKPAPSHVLKAMGRRSTNRLIRQIRFKPGTIIPRKKGNGG